MSNLDKAIELAAVAHAGQTDKAGEPYILHPIRVMLSVETRSQRIVAVLHDIVEDTSVTFEDLVHEGFSQGIVEAVQALTKYDGESRIEAAKRAAKDPIARIVKLADVTDNMDMGRIPNPTDKDYSRLKEYESVRRILLAGSE